MIEHYVSMEHKEAVGKIQRIGITIRMLSFMLIKCMHRYLLTCV
jgi:hypothetical protein